MRIERLVFTGVGPFAEASFAFPEPQGPGELVLFEGPNGSGKTTIVQVIAALGGLLARGLDFGSVTIVQRCWGRSEIAVAVSHDHRTLELTHVGGNDGAWLAEDRPMLSTFMSDVGEPHRMWRWAAFAYVGHQETARLHTEGPKEIKDHPLSGSAHFGRHSPASQHLGQLLTNIENERTKALTYARERTDPQERAELEQRAESRREAIGRFERVFSEVLDRKVTIAFSIDQQAPEVRFDGEVIPLDLLGEGMRSTFSWLADLLVRLERVPWEDRVRSPLDQDFWLILDEIDESLHPRMQARILPALRRLLPNARIYATTHSPFVVASVGEGTIFAIRPDPDHRVRGEVTPRRLVPGQSLELVTSEIFDVPAEFVDEGTREKLAAHEQDVRAIERGGEIDWPAFLARRRALLSLNDEVRTAVAMQELPVRQTVQRRAREAGEGQAA